MGLMNKTEYAQACLFRIREALETTKAWWEHDPKLTHAKIEQTLDMLEDIIDELLYFQEKIQSPDDEDIYTNIQQDDHGYGFEPSNSEADSRGGLFIQ